MKKLLLLPIAMLSICCCSQKQATIAKVNFSENTCPTDGECTIELLSDKSLNVQQDGLGGTYYQLLDNKGTNVIRYEYNRHKNPELADDGYREEVLFEVPSSISELKLSGFEMQNVKALYGRFCFCRGATGYYRIQDGNLTIKKEKNEYRIDMNFNITEVPQIIKSFRLTAK